jgi:CRP/FNR family cyclic AMP-dependent transcriptional regulator
MTQVSSGLFAARFPALAPALGEEDLDVLLAALQVQEVVPSEALVAEGTPVDDLFLVWDGQLDVSVATSAGERSVGTVGPGSFLGEVSLLDPGPATATVTAEQGCTVLHLSRTRFDELCSSHPRLAAALLGEIGRTLADRLRRGVTALEVSGAVEGSRVAPPDPEQVLSVHAALHAGSRS